MRVHLKSLMFSLQPRPRCTKAANAQNQPCTGAATHLASCTLPPPSQTRMCKCRAPCICRCHMRRSTLQHGVRCRWGMAVQCGVGPLPRGEQYTCLALYGTVACCNFLQLTASTHNPTHAPGPTLQFQTRNTSLACCPPGESHVAPSQPDSHVQVPGAVQLPWSHAAEHTAARGVVQKGVWVQCEMRGRQHVCT